MFNSDRCAEVLQGGEEEQARFAGEAVPEGDAEAHRAGRQKDQDQGEEQGR